jgi:SAM-dependent methyltransferase
MSDVSGQMRTDWNRRAREDAHYYVAFGGRNQDEAGFLETAKDVVRVMEMELRRLPRAANRRTWRALEIGCGPGRLIKLLAHHFGEIHGVDVSDEMIGLARERLRGIPQAHVHATSGAGLPQFADESFDFVYSYAVFQHIPSREVVLEYMRDVARVLKVGGVFRGQFNGLPPASNPDTWAGVSFSSDDIHNFTRAAGLELLALEGMHTQYMWTTWRRRGAALVVESGAPAIRRITNAYGSEPVIPQRGPYAALSLWTLNLPHECDLNTLEVRIDGASATPVYLGPAEIDGVQQINVMLPPNTRTGLVPVELLHNGRRLCEPATARVIPAGPLVPRIVSVTDGINVIERNRSTTGAIKLQLEEVLHPELISATLGGKPVRDVQIALIDPVRRLFEVNCRLPEELADGSHQLRVWVGERALPPVEVDKLLSCI